VPHAAREETRGCETEHFMLILIIDSDSSHNKQTAGVLQWLYGNVYSFYMCLYKGAGWVDECGAMVE